jgi:hypothetical protein
MDERTLPEGLDPDILHRVVTNTATVVNLHDMTHEARVRDFTFRSDEPPDLAGEDLHPRPLEYLSAAIGL